jgi:hypothetical protein
LVLLLPENFIFSAMRVILLFALLVVFFNSCTKDKTTSFACTEDISFASDVQPILINSCATAGCHNSISAANNMIFENYDAVYTHRVLIVKSIRHEAGVTPMPIGPQLSSELIRKISCWVEQGAPNN